MGIGDWGLDKFGIGIKSSDKVKSLVFEIQMRGNCCSQITCTKQYHGSLNVKTKYLSYLKPEFAYIVAVTLLSEFAETI